MLAPAAVATPAATAPAPPTLAPAPAVTAATVAAPPLPPPATKRPTYSFLKARTCTHSSSRLSDFDQGAVQREKRSPSTT